MVSRATCGFSMQQNWIAVGRGQGEDHLLLFSCTRGTMQHSASAASSASRLGPQK